MLRYNANFETQFSYSLLEFWTQFEEQQKYIANEERNANFLFIGDSNPVCWNSWCHHVLLHCWQSLPFTFCWSILVKCSRSLDLFASVFSSHLFNVKSFNTSPSDFGPLLPKTFHLHKWDPNASIKTKRNFQFKGDPHMAAIEECARARETESYWEVWGAQRDPFRQFISSLTQQARGSDTHQHDPPPWLHSVLPNVTQTPDSIKDPSLPPSPLLLNGQSEPNITPGWDEWSELMGAAGRLEQSPTVFAHARSDCMALSGADWP